MKSNSPAPDSCFQRLLRRRRDIPQHATDFCKVVPWRAESYFRRDFASNHSLLRIVARSEGVSGASQDPHPPCFAHPLCRNERVKETPSASLYASPAKAGAYRSAARAHPAGKALRLLQEVPSGGGMGPGFPHGTSPWAKGPREGEGRFADYISSAISSHALRGRGANNPHPNPPPRAARLSGESVTTGCSKICRRSVALTTRPFTPLPPLAGGEGRVRGADEPVCGAAHLTLPTLRLGPSLSPLKGGEGLVSAGIIFVDASRAIKFSSPDSLASRGRVFVDNLRSNNS